MGPVHPYDSPASDVDVHPVRRNKHAVVHVVAVIYVGADIHALGNGRKEQKARGTNLSLLDWVHVLYGNSTVSCTPYSPLADGQPYA